MCERSGGAYVSGWSAAGQRTERYTAHILAERRQGRRNPAQPCTGTTRLRLSVVSTSTGDKQSTRCLPATGRWRFVLNADVYGICRYLYVFVLYYATAASDKTISMADTICGHTSNYSYPLQLSSELFDVRNLLLCCIIHCGHKNVYTWL